MESHIENEFAEFWIEGVILFFVYKSGVSIDRSAAIKVLEDRLKLQEGKAFLILCDIRGVKDVDKSARNYLALEGSVLIKAVALLVNAPLSTVISGFYIKTSRPPIPTKVFTEEKDALEYLDTFNTV